MILRRITEHVKAQNWFAVGLDFLIVVIGVFVGLQVNNWNEARAENNRATNYRESLASDLQNDIGRMTNAIALKNQVIEFGRTALNAARNKQTDDPWPVIYAFFQASQAGGPVTVNTTYQELTSSGEVRLIDELDVRQELANYYTETNLNDIISVLPVYREAVRGLVPFDVQEYIWEHCYLTGVNNQKLLPCEPPATADHLSEVASHLVDDQQLVRHLRFWLSNETASVLILEQRRKDAESLREALLKP
ncbi:hypothetical protein [Hyphococcus sp.]|uniref:hypothetical protein n=1 Tax=Hyphococcus sp. TaxID=2038636 RepID=UPI00208D7F9D|nr:MAG: hypothetical protein DHS20C04_10040 [Marinicaulis sp.]